MTTTTDTGAPPRLDPVHDWLAGGHARPSLEEVEAAGFVVVERHAASYASGLIDWHADGPTEATEKARSAFEAALHPARRLTSAEVYRSAVWTR